MGRHSKVEDPAPRSDRAEGSGYHRAIGMNRPRGVAKWPIACLVAVAVFSVAWVAWAWGNDILSNRAEAQAKACTDGSSLLTVAAAPAIADEVADAARRWNTADRVVHDRCVTVEVVPANTETVLAVVGRGDEAEMPAAWIPQYRSSVAELTRAHPHRVAGAPVPINEGDAADYPFVAITGDGVDPVQERAAQVFRRFLLDAEQQALFAP